MQNEFIKIDPCKMHILTSAKPYSIIALRSNAVNYIVIQQHKKSRVLIARLFLKE